MERARITEPGIVAWTELCYCTPPLAHERATVYDRFFTDIRIVEASEHVRIKGESFVEFLRASALTVK